MGTEISQSRFEHADFEAFRQRLAAETRILKQWFADDAIPQRPPEAGYELEAWLVNSQAKPAPEIDRLLPLIHGEHAVPELARFNIELNGNAFRLEGNALTQMYEEIIENWSSTRHAAKSLNLDLMMIGMLPTADHGDFSLEAMSPLQRYRALNEQIFLQRKDQPLQLDIKGTDHLQTQHHDVMLEAATTSFQIHLRTTPQEAARLFNISKIVSAPIVALAANSPYLFGHDLWAETRIPVFEQTIEVGKTDLTKRVSFGVRYAEQSIMEVFDANLQRYPILLPELMDESPENLAHLRLHNGTIWRWNRPLVGFDPDGSPHLRIEHRVVPSGPTPADSVANAAFYFGITRALHDEETAIEKLIPFETARDNFYRCARYGLDSSIRWREGKEIPIKRLILDLLLPKAAEGLHALGIEQSETDRWLQIIRERVDAGQNGANWQRRWMKRTGASLQEMTLAYLENQNSDLPVHRWPV